jgi:hypothetical protein
VFEQTPKTMACFAIEKGEGHLAVISMNQIAFAESAACQVLHGVNTAHISFGDAHQLTVRKIAKLSMGKLRGPNPDTEPRARMPMEAYNPINSVF